MKNGADVLVEGLALWDVRHIFGMPGSHSATIYDAIARAGLIRTTLVRNEQAAAFAADGYARVTGQPGVVCTTAGPGATNALTGVAECWADSVPILLLAGQVNAEALDRECGNYHEIDLQAVFQPVTTWCGTVRRVEEIPALLGRAFQAMTWERPRPAALFLPQDLMRSPCPVSAQLTAFAPRPQPAVPTEAIARAAELLGRAIRPIILAGGGALWSRAAAEVEALARALNAPVVTTLNGKGLIDERSPVSLGHARSSRGRLALAHADLMLAVGCRFTEVMTDWRRMTVPKSLIQIDVDPVQIGMNYPVVQGIVADAKSAVSALVAALPPSAHAPVGVGCGRRRAPLGQPSPSGLSTRCARRFPVTCRSLPMPARWAIACTPTGRPTARGGSSIHRTILLWVGPSRRLSARPWRAAASLSCR